MIRTTYLTLVDYYSPRLFVAPVPLVFKLIGVAMRCFAGHMLDLASAVAFDEVFCVRSQIPSFFKSLLGTILATPSGSQVAWSASGC